MSEVTSVNGKAGTVVLAATDVEAVPESEVGQPNGVATLNASGELPEAQLPSSVVSSRVKNLGEISGTYTLNVQKLLEEGYGAIVGMIVGATEFRSSTWLAGIDVEVPVYLEQDATGHTLSVPGAAWTQGEEPVWSTTPLAWNNFVLASPNGGTTVFGVKAAEKGAAGTNGTTPTVGEWLALEEVNAKLKEATEEEKQTVRGREMWGVEALLRGSFEVVTSEVAGTTTLFKVPEALRPPSATTVVVNGATIGTAKKGENPCTLIVKHTGLVTTEAKAAVGKFIHLGNARWMLT